MISRPRGINDCQSRQSDMSALLLKGKQAASERGLKKARPSSSKTYMSITTKTKMRASQTNSIRSLKPPGIPKSTIAKKNYHLKKPSQTAKNTRTVLSPKEITEGDRLINAIDKGYEYIKAQDAHNNLIPTGMESMEDIYA